MTAEQAVSPTQVERPSGNARTGDSIVQRLLSSPEGYLFGFIVVVWVFLAIKSAVFLTERNIGVLLSQVALIAITGFGMTLVADRTGSRSLGRLDAGVRRRGGHAGPEQVALPAGGHRGGDPARRYRRVSSTPA